MQYQVFVQNQSEQRFVASVVGMPNVTAEGRTEEEAIMNAKTALAEQLAMGRFVTIELTAKDILDVPNSAPMKYAGVFEDDPTFEEFMDHLAKIRQKANHISDRE